MALVTLEDVTRAAGRLAGVVQQTPVEESRAVSGLAGHPTVLKCEHLQRTGSFKIRGAYNRIAGLSDRERERGVVCSSAGNHAQGVALSAALVGVPATVFMPVGVPLPKLEATRGYGATVVLAGDSYDDAHAAAQAWTREHEATFVHPFDHLDVIAGQGTIGLELLEQVPDLGAVLVPVGGGGLVSGIAAAIKAVRPEVRVIGVQAAGAAAVPASLAAGAPRTLPETTTFADGIAVRTPGALTLAHIAAHVDEVVTVSDEAIARAVLVLVERAKQVVEPAGAAGLAALLEGVTMGAGTVVPVLAGGNVDPLLLARLLQSGLFEEGRYFAFRTRLRDRPGALSHLLALIGDAGANVVAISHHRLGTRLGVLEVEVQIEVEARGHDHIRQLEGSLTAAGYPV
ncbi:MAG: threonine ammonia-lyase, partial [Egibacteraceae bacterium]